MRSQRTAFTYRLRLDMLARSGRVLIGGESIMTPQKFVLYEWLEGHFLPRSFLWKIFLVVFPITEVPMMSVIIYLVMQHGTLHGGKVLKTGLLTILCSTAIVLWSLHQLFRPLELARRTLLQFTEHGKELGLPLNYRDEVGMLLRSIHYTLRSFDFQKRSLERLAAQDHLTALPNRRATERYLTQWMRELPSIGPLAMGLIDIDHFKAINDRFGHAAGDSVLTAFSEHVSHSLRRGDWIARWAGDEFLLVIRANSDEAAGIFDRLCQEIALREVKYKDQIIRFSVSIGYSMAVFGETWGQVVERADDALYDAKRDGRSRAFLRSTSQHASSSIHAVDNWRI